VKGVGSFAALLCLIAVLLCGVSAIAADAPKTLRTEANVPVEITFSASQAHADPFNEVTFDVTFKAPSGTLQKVPGFWAGGDKWKVRYAAALPGTYQYRTECNDRSESGLNDLQGSVEVTLFRGGNLLFQHGPIRVAQDKRHMEHADGTPFFWLGDTWWMGLCNRLRWPEDFQQLAADRKAKGFTVVQIVAGLYPDMFPFDPRGANEAGYPWQTNYSSIRPEYFNAADQRLRYLVDQGLTPCIVGAWGYFMPWMGVEKMERHWRYLIARYGAWPVVWCAAGEANLPWYLAKGFPYDDRKQVHDWTEVMRFIRATDPFHRPLTIHPTGIGRLSARNATEDTGLLDFDMLQTPHGRREAVAPTVRTMRESYPDTPVMPVINGEASYEMLMDSIPAQWPRAMFWLCMVNGAAGHTYGANGIWQVNRRGQPHGASPNGTGNGYGVISWDEAMRLPGSEQVAYGKKFFESLPWTELKPMPESAIWAGSPDGAPLGNWIWFPEGDPKRDAPVEARFFRRTFALPEMPVKRASLRLSVDDRFMVWLNGRQIGSGNNWQTPDRFEVASFLSPHQNVIAVRAENLKAPVALNPAGLSAALKIEFTDGSSTNVSSDKTWLSAKAEVPGWKEIGFNDSAWVPALVTAKFGQPPWGSVGKQAATVAPQSCGISDRLRVIYLLDPNPITVRGLKPDKRYRLTRFDPVRGSREPAEEIKTTQNGEAMVPPPAHGHDWVLLLEQSDSGEK
jgi:hypothetical protein